LQQHQLMVVVEPVEATVPTTDTRIQSERARRGLSFLTVKEDGLERLAAESLTFALDVMRGRPPARRRGGP
jgi:hypothetical protein